MSRFEPDPDGLEDDEADDAEHADAPRPRRRSGRARPKPPAPAPAEAWFEVVERVGRWVRVRTHDGQDRVLPTRGAHVVVADRVRVADGLVVETAPRRTVLERTGESAGVRTVCSNADRLMIVTASGDPPFRPGLVDRMVVAALHGGLEPVVVLNKCDTGMEESVLEWMARYEALGYPIVLVSAQTGNGLDALRAQLAGHTSVLLGHSGVGKSTLIRALIPGAEPLTGELDAWGRGRHTTTAARMYDLPGAGRLIDVPGVREFGVAQIPREELRHHFPELVDLACRYRDCLHLGEDGCVADAAVSWPERLESYRKLVEECV